MRRASALILASSLITATGLFGATCNYEAPWWDGCCECECEDCDQVPERIFAPKGVGQFLP